MTRTKTLNELGKCECGSQSFTMLEHIETRVLLDVQTGVLRQIGKIIMSEIQNVECDTCLTLYDVTQLGEVQLKDFGE